MFSRYYNSKLNVYAYIGILSKAAEHFVIRTMNKTNSALNLPLI